ncbi:MAG: hypothetical protein ACI9VR_002361 [Cognaticolwellia sp.]|jgi:hypothetical protein
MAGVLIYLYFQELNFLDFPDLLVLRQAIHQTWGRVLRAAMSFQSGNTGQAVPPRTIDAPLIKTGQAYDSAQGQGWPRPDWRPSLCR